MNKTRKLKEEILFEDHKYSSCFMIFFSSYIFVFSTVTSFRVYENSLLSFLSVTLCFVAYTYTWRIFKEKHGLHLGRIAHPIDAAYSSETEVNVYQSIRSHTQENSNLQHSCR